MSFDAVLLASFGGPEGQEDVIPFLRNVTRGRGVPEQRLEEVAHHYRAHGGVSPINQQNRDLKAALETELAARGLELPVIWGNRNWDPYFPDALREAHAAGHRRLLALVTSAYTSYSGVGQYLEDFDRALNETGLRDELQISKIREFFDHPGFVTPFVEGVDAALARIAAERPTARPHVLFVTHSIPTAAAEASGPEHGPGGAYVAQHLAVAQVIMQSATGIPWTLVYQSRSGSPSVPWLEPDINDAIEELAADGVDALAIVPLGFVSDHMEVVWDLDTEAIETAQGHGMLAIRVPTPGVHPAFVSGLVDLIAERLDDVPDAQRPHLTALGPWPDLPPSGLPRRTRATTALRIGTRGSALALAQTEGVAAALAATTGAATELVTVTTAGDRSTEPLSQLGGTGVFASALREALLAGDCDLVVHSLKDLPTAPFPGLMIAAVPIREDAHDALCARDGLSLDALPSGSRIGTGSPRRAAQLRAHRDDLEVIDVRGNVDTRLGKVSSGELDGVILAAAGLNRIGRAAAITERFDLNDWPTAPGQGALAIEVRTGEERVVSSLEHRGTRVAVEAERRVLALLEAGCSAPVGAHAFLDDGLLSLTARVYSLDGAQSLTAAHAVPLADAANAATLVAAELLAAGAAELTGASA